uniref:Uncharacterized protein n=1 Tax=Tanacetum cinerariifolium TaxID=118510 RepID=A0A6L2KXY1_TANCI|nr:hypothetical protein [Tanacetum cinerariifolium]
MMGQQVSNPLVEMMLVVVDEHQVFEVRFVAEQKVKVVDDTESDWLKMIDKLCINLDWVHGHSNRMYVIYQLCKPQAIRVNCLSRKHFKILSLDESISPDFDLFCDHEEYLEEEVAKTMAETTEQYMRKTQADYGSGVVRPKIEEKDNFELKS